MIVLQMLGIVVHIWHSENLIFSDFVCVQHKIYWEIVGEFLWIFLVACS